MKKDKYYEIAEKMYTEQFITVAGIAKRLGVNERTIKRWKKDGNWTEKRYQANFNSELKNGNKIDTSRLNVFLNLVEELVKKEQKDFEIEEFIKIAQKRLDYEEEMLKEMENEMKAEMQKSLNNSI